MSGDPDLHPDPDRPGGWCLDVGGVPQSYVDVDDPTHLEFDYVRRLADVLDAIAAPGMPLRVVHVGGAALTLPRYVAATRPGSRQLVLEVDGALVELVRARLPWRRGSGIRVRVAEGRTAMRGLPDAAAAAVVVDAFTDGRVPEHLTTRECMRDAARVVGPDGVFLLNVADGPPLRYWRRVAAAALAVWPQVAVVADPGVLRGRRFGNVVLAGSAAPLPLPAMTRAAAGAAFPARVVDAEALTRLVAGARPSTDADPAASPTPPELWSSARPSSEP